MMYFLSIKLLIEDEIVRILMFNFLAKYSLVAKHTPLSCVKKKIWEYITRSARLSFWSCIILSLINTPSIAFSFLFANMLLLVYNNGSAFQCPLPHLLGTPVINYFVCNIKNVEDFCILMIILY